MTDEFGNKPSGGQRTYKGMWRIHGMKDQLANDLESTAKTTKTDKITLNENCVWEGIGII